MIPRWRLLNTILAASLSGPFNLWSYVVGELLRWLFYGKACGHIAPSRASKQHVYSSTPIVNSRALEILVSGETFRIALVYVLTRKTEEWQSRLDQRRLPAF